MRTVSSSARARYRARATHLLAVPAEQAALPAVMIRRIAPPPPRLRRGGAMGAAAARVATEPCAAAATASATTAPVEVNPAA